MVGWNMIFMKHGSGGPRGGILCLSCYFTGMYILNLEDSNGNDKSLSTDEFLGNNGICHCHVRLRKDMHACVACIQYN